MRRLGPRLDDVLGQLTEDALTILQYDRIEVDELADTVAHVVGNAGDRIAAETVPNQDDVVEIFVFDQVGDVGNKQVEIDRLRDQVRTLAEARLRRCYDRVATASQN